MNYVVLLLLYILYQVCIVTIIHKTLKMVKNKVHKKEFFLQKKLKNLTSEQWPESSK